MIKDIPRLRMFAGPNGSGKSTIKKMVRPELLGIYVNPDEIEKEIKDDGFLDLETYQVLTTEQEILNFFEKSTLLEKNNYIDVGSNSYFASVAADFIRQKLIDTSKSFTFETVMSFPDKIKMLRLLNLSLLCGYRRSIDQYLTCALPRKHGQT